MTRFTSFTLLSLVVGMGFAPSPRANAQFAGGSAPTGTPVLNFTVPGVHAFSGFSTVFTCTNPTGMTVDVAVELFDQNGAAQNLAVPLSLPPGGTKQFATYSVTFNPDQLLNPVNFVGGWKGAAKIWSTSNTLHCSAILAHTAGNWAPLPLIARGKKQKGD
jgi:hypothetical protein